MQTLRKLTKWIAGHRLLTALVVLGLVFVAAFARRQLSRAQGRLTPPIERGDIVESVYGIGTVMANRSFQIKPGVTSTINELYVREGDSVPKGGRLAVIDGVPYRAPFSGTVTYLPFKVGENIFAQAVVLSLVDLVDRYLVVNLEQQGALRVRAKQRAILSFDSLRERRFEGVVASVYSNESNFLARIDLSALPRAILPGMTADVAITIQEHKDVLLIPVAALEGDTVWVKRGRGLVHEVEVKTGIVDGAMAELVSGDVRAGDRLLIRKKITP